MYENYAVLWSKIADRSPDTPAIRTATQSYTYGEWDAAAETTAQELATRGVTAGDRVAFFLHNTAEYLVVFFACLKLEAIPVSINYRLRDTELAALIGACTPTAIVFGGANREVISAVLDSPLSPEVASVRFLIEVATEPGAERDALPVPVFRSEDLIAPKPSSENILPTNRARATPSRDAELYIFTGGTTGVPKAVVWRIGDLMHVQESSIYAPIGIAPPSDLDAAVQIASSQKLPQVVTLPLAPFIHATALFSAMNTLAIGGLVIINPNASLVPAAAAELIRAEGVTRLIVAGDAVATPLLDALELRGDVGRLALNSVISSGMRFSDETKRRFHMLGRVTIVDILASTEGGPYAIATSTNSAELPATFRLTPEAVVLDEQGTEIQNTPGATGVLAYRGPLPLGYLDDPEKSAETYPLINGVRHCSPGDFVRVGAEGRIELLGRGSAVVNTGGEKVFPGEVEEALLRHPAVADAVVFGMPDLRWGEAVTAVIAVEPGLVTSEHELRGYLSGKLAGFKKPRTILIRSSLDRSPTGKINMPALHEAVARAKAQLTTEEGISE